MQASLIQIKIKERVNKGDSADYDNLECWQIREAYNKEQLEWTRRQIHGKNDTQEGDEESAQRVNDLQTLLQPATLEVRKNGVFFEAKHLPADLLFLKRVTPVVSCKKCKEKTIKSTLREEANVDEYLQDWSMQPSFEFEETFHTMINDTIRVYANGEFEVKEIKIVYYRIPRSINFGNCQQMDGSSGTEIDPEFKDDIVELIIDGAVSILAGDIESPNAMQITKQRSEINN